MTQAEYDSMRARGHGLSNCPTCRARTWFTHDDHGALFCVSCGHEAEVTGKGATWSA
jgi:Zn ribbon nucleic-acid-binding protein